MAKLLTLSQIGLGTGVGAGDGDPGRTGGTTINANTTDIVAAVNALAGQFWTLDNTARALALGERLQSDTHAGITHTLPATFDYDVGGFNDVWVANHDDTEDITIAVASGDQMYRQGTGLGVDTSFALKSGQLAILSIRADSVSWNLIVLADEQTIEGTATGGGGLTGVVKTANYTASASESVYVGTNTGAITITLPVTPTTNDVVEIKDIDGNAAANNVTVGRNGETIDGESNDYTLVIGFSQASFIYDGTTWKHALTSTTGRRSIAVSTVYSAIDRDVVFADSSSAAFTITLPVNPNDNDVVSVYDAKGSAAANNITIGRNGETINGSATDYVLAMNWEKLDLIYTNSNWQVAISNEIDAVFNNQAGTTYTIQESDAGKIITFDNASSIAVSLPDTLAINFQCTIVQVGAGIPTVTPNTDTINGAGAGVTPSAQWKGMYLSQYSATNWIALL